MKIFSGCQNVLGRRRLCNWSAWFTGTQLKRGKSHTYSWTSVCACMCQCTHLCSTGLISFTCPLEEVCKEPRRQGRGRREKKGEETTEEERRYEEEGREEGRGEERKGEMRKGNG